jgi:hypothetical protein
VALTALATNSAAGMGWPGCILRAAAMSDADGHSVRSHQSTK